MQNIFPLVVFGAMCPYPTVVMIVMVNSRVLSKLGRDAILNYSTITTTITRMTAITTTTMRQ